MDSSFFRIDLSSISAGLSHQRSNLTALIRYCFDNNLKLIKPIFRLTKHHNNGIEVNSDLSEYNDLDNILVNNQPYKVYDNVNNIDYTIPKIYNCRLLRTHILFANANTNLIRVYIPPKQSIVDQARQIANVLGDNYMCIHVRRGDRITSQQIDTDTQPHNIISAVSKYPEIKTVYIMSNRINELTALRSHNDYKFYFYTEFPSLTNITDNYYLFSVENEIMKLASVRCSTFNTGSSKYYTCYLTNSPG